MSPTPRAAIALALLALVALFVPVRVTLGLALALVVAVGYDTLVARRPLRVDAHVPGAVARGVPSHMTVAVAGDAPARVRIRQAQPPDVAITPPTGHGRARRRARRIPPRPARPARARRPPRRSAGPGDLVVRGAANRHPCSRTRTCPRPAGW